MKKKILIIEDNFETQLVFKIYLREFYEITISDNATDGLEEIKNNNFDLLILDVNLPGKLDGNDVLRILKKEFQLDIRVIVVTAYAMKGDREKFLAQGADDYIAKPVEKAFLLKRIAAHLSDE